MTTLARRLRNREPVVEQRFSTLDELAALFTYNGSPYVPTTMHGDQLRAATNFVGMVSQGYAGNSIVSAVEDVRLSVFSEASPVFRRRRRGRGSELFGNNALRILEQPWTGGCFSDLLKIMLVHADFAGNAYVTRHDDGIPGRLTLMRPDWVDVVLASHRDADDPMLAFDAEKVGYVYYPDGNRDGRRDVFTVDEVAHFWWKPDPTAWWRGMSWLSPVIRDVQADHGATDHKKRFFENAATPNLAIKFDPLVQLEQVRQFKEMFNEEHRGASNAFKTLFLGGGADLTPVGSTFNEMQLKATQGAGETRIAAAAGVPPSIAGLSEGLQGSSLNAGNYTAARRRFADGTMRPLWRSVFNALSMVVDVPAGAELWFDDADISFLQEDVKDAAEIQGRRAGTIRSLVEGGFDPASVIAAVSADDMTLLEHTGLVSVQLSEPGSQAAATTEQG